MEKSEGVSLLKPHFCSSTKVQQQAKGKSSNVSHREEAVTKTRHCQIRENIFVSFEFLAILEFSPRISQPLFIPPNRLSRPEAKEPAGRSCPVTSEQAVSQSATRPARVPGHSRPQRGSYELARSPSRPARGLRTKSSSSPIPRTCQELRPPYQQAKRKSRAKLVHRSPAPSKIWPPAPCCT